MFGRKLLPGSAFLEAAWAAGAVLTDDAVPDHMLHVLQNVSIEAPFILPDSLADAPFAKSDGRSRSR